MRILSLIFLILIFLSSCTVEKNKKNYTEKMVNGIFTIKSTSSPSEPDFKYDFKEVMTLSSETAGGNSFGKVDYLAVDSKENIYLADLITSSIKKFSKSGKYLKSFGQKGSGPGEYSILKNMTILNDTIIISDPQSRKMIKFDENGNYISEKKFAQSTPEFLTPSNKQNQILGILINVDQLESGLKLKSSIVSMDNQFNQVNSFSEAVIPLDPTNPQFNPMDLMQPYIASADNIFISEISDYKFNIKVFDFTGKQIKNIAKNYKKVKMSKDEIKRLNSTVSTTVNEETNENKGEFIFHKAIYGLWVDKYDRLWVLRAKENMKDDPNGISFDIFDKGIFKNTIHFPYYKDELNIEVNIRIKFFGDYLYFIDDKDDLKIRVFNY